MNILLGVALLLGTAITLEFTGPVFYFGCYYGVSFLILHSFRYGESFYIPLEGEEGKSLRDQKIKLAGQEIISEDNEEAQEERFMNALSFTKNLKRKVVSSIMTGLAIFMVFAVFKTELSLVTGIPFICGYFIMNSFYVGHLLIPLFINAFFVVVLFRGEFLPALFLYTVLVLTYLAMMNRIKTRVQLSYVFSIGLVFMIVTASVSFLLPQKFDAHKKTFKIPEAVRHEMIKVLGDKEEMLRSSPTSTETIKILEKLKHLKLNVLKPELSEIQREGLEKEINQVFRELGALDQKYQETKKIKMEQVLREMNIGALGQNEQKIQRDNIEKVLREIEKTTLNKSSLNEEGRYKVDKIQKLLNQSDARDPEALRDLVNDVSRELEKTPASSQSSPLKIVPSDLEKEKLLRPLKPKKDSFWFRLIKKAIPIIIIILIVLVFQFYLGRKGIRYVDSEDPSLLAELRNNWRILQKKKMAPREEVIQYYNFFHDSLQKIHYASHEAPPACLINEDMKELNPSLHKSTYIITDLFSRCFYGNKEVHAESLRDFRKAMKNVIKVYGLG